MKSIRFCLFLAVSFLTSFPIFFTRFALAQNDEEALLVRINQSIEKVRLIQDRQQEILKSQEAAIEELKHLMVWVNRRR